MKPLLLLLTPLTLIIAGCASKAPESEETRKLKESLLYLQVLRRPLPMPADAAQKQRACVQEQTALQAAYLSGALFGYARPSTNPMIPAHRARLKALGCDDAAEGEQ